MSLQLRSIEEAHAPPGRAAREPIAEAPVWSAAGDPVRYLSGRNVFLRPPEVVDVEQFRRWMNSPYIRERLSRSGPLSEAAEKEFIESANRKPGEYHFAICDAADGRLIGGCGAHQLSLPHRSARMGIFIGDPAGRGRGYGMEAVRLLVEFAFAELNLDRLDLEVLADNWPAICAYQKAGFKPEGCLRQARYKAGHYVDVYIFSILRSEWETMR